MHFETIPKEKGAKLVFGLEWRAYATKGAGAERRRYAHEFAATHYVELKGKEETVAGFCAPELAERKGVKLYSAAARVAMLERVRGRAAVLVLIQDEQRVHLISVIRGAVSADEDVALIDLRARRDAIEDQCAKERLELQTIGYGDALQDVDAPFALSELLTARKAGLITKVPVKVPVVVPLFVIAVAGFFGISKIVEVLNPPPPPPPPPPSYMQDYQTAVRRTLAAPAPLASVLAPSLLERFGQQETNIAGWQFYKGACGTTGYCSTTYKREGGTFKDFDTLASPDIRPVSFNPDGLHLSTPGPQISLTEKVTLAQSKAWPSEQAMIKQLQTDPQRLSVVPEALQSHGYIVSIREPHRLLPRQPGPGDVRGQLVEQGDWQIDGYKWQSSLLARLPANMALETLDIELKDDGSGVHFTAKGKYYVLQ
jgi:hypothetical protein